MFTALGNLRHRCHLLNRPADFSHRQNLLHLLPRLVMTETLSQLPEKYTALSSFHSSNLYDSDLHDILVTH